MAMDHPERIGDYKIIEFLGSGGMSVVYHAYDSKMDREIAIKMLKTEDFSESMALRFHREAKAASQLQHPNIIRIYDFGLSEDNQPYMVLEYLKGEALDRHIKKKGSLDVEEAIDLATQITDGMIHAHKANVIHRDLKPSNIMLVDGPSPKFGMAKILDFGIAKVTEITDKTLTRTGLVVGSPNYMSPEQARGEEVDVRSDIYSTGCILFEMLTGIQPFRGDTFLTTLSNQINNPAPKLSEVSRYDFDDRVERIISICLAKDPEQRYKTMEELKDALDNCLKQTAEESETDESYAPSYTMSPEFEQKQKSFNWIPVLAVFGVLGITALIVTRLMDTEELPEINKKDSKTTKKIVIDESKGYKFSVSPRDGPGDLLVIPAGFTGSRLADLEKYKPLKEVKLWSLSSEFKDSDLKYLAPLKLEVLGLINSQIDNEGLAIVSKRKSLKSLILNNCQNITDAGLDSLNDIPELEILSVSGSKNITDEGVQKIARNKNLVCLDVRECPKVTGKCLNYLKDLPNLRCLLFKQNKITRDEFKKLADFKNLEFLDLIDMDIKDSDIDLLPASMNLVGIDLRNNRQITDKTMETLQKFQQLRYVDVRQSKVADEEELECVMRKRHHSATVKSNGETGERHEDITRFYSTIEGISLYYIPELYDGYDQFISRCFARRAAQEAKNLGIDLGF